MATMTRKIWLAAALCLLVCTPAVYSQASNEDDSNNDAVENDGGREADENDGNDGDDSSIGANPPSSLIGCTSPYAYLAASPGLEIFRELIEATDLETVFKYRNFTGTLLAPSNFAFRNLADASGTNLDPDEAKLDDQLIQSLIQYHVILDTVDPTTLAAQEGSQSYDTALALTPTGTDSLYPRAAGDVFFRDPAVIYENITIDVTLAAGANVNDAPNGTFAVTAAGSTANIIWDDTVEPVRTCVGYVYRVDNILLPRSALSTLSSGGAPSPGPASDENDGQNEGDGDLAPAAATETEENDSEGSEGASGM